MGKIIATASPWTKLNVTRTIVSTLAAIYRKGDLSSWICEREHIYNLKNRE